MKQQADVAIVGAGIIGLLAARELSRKGRKVCLLDAGERRPCASWAGGGILSPLFPWRYPGAVSRLTDTAMPRYRRLLGELRAEGAGEVEINPCGLLVLGEKQLDEASDWCREHGIALRSLPACRIQPGLGEQQALWLPELGAIRNSRLLSVLERSLRQQGVPVKQQPVTGIQPSSQGWQLQAGAEQITAGQLLIAAGAWSGELLRPLGIQLPLAPVKGQMALYQAPKEALKSVLLTDEGYLIPRRDGRVLVGSTLEPEATDMLPSEAAQQQLNAIWQRLWPQQQAAHQLAQWAGWRPGPNDIPLIGELPGETGLFVCSGHYRNGICAAPASVELLVAQMCGEALPFAATDYQGVEKLPASPALR